jgi:copper chaperone CopZ
MRFELMIPGMHAIHARNAVFTALGAVEGIVRAEVELGRAVVEVGPGSRVDEEMLREAVGAAGFVVEKVSVLPRILPVL